MRYINLRFTLL